VKERLVTCNEEDTDGRKRRVCKKKDLVVFSLLFHVVGDELDPDDGLHHV